MDDGKRLLAKALTWQVMGLVSMTALGWAFTGSPGLGGALALTSGAVGFASYLLHERLWDRVDWGRGGKRRRS